MIAVIMAGGKGTRLLEITGDELPKPMVSVCGKPILLHQIETLKENGITSFILVVGHKREKIFNFFGDGKKFGVSIEYIEEEIPLGTAGALYYLKERELTDFLLIFGDLIFDIDVQQMIRFHKEKNALATLFVHPNSHPYDSDLVVLDETNRVIGFDSKKNVRNYYDNCVNAGIYVVNKLLITSMTEATKTDFEKDILLERIQKQDNIYGYASPEYVKDVGTVERIHKTEQDIENGIVKSRNLKNKQSVLFLDRDGTINEYVGLVAKPEQLQVMENAYQAIENINRSNFLCIIITNQPVVARGVCSLEQVHEIHKKLQADLGNRGCFVDDIVFCPHHPDKGYPEENPVYKIDCNCRKPNIGMIEDCVKKYNIDLSASYFVGDTTSDIQTGKNAGIKTILVKTGEGGIDGKYDVKSDFVCTDLHEAVNIITNMWEEKNGL